MSATPSVMFAITNLNRGGAQTQVVSQATALAQRGWSVSVVTITPRMDPGHMLSLREAGVDVLSLNFPSGRRWSSLFCPPRMARVIRKHRPDVLVGFLYQGIMTSRLAGRVMRVPVVVTSIRNQRTGRLQDRVLRLTNWAADAVTTMSAGVARELGERGVAPPSREIVVIPNGVDVAAFDPDACTGSLCRTQVRKEMGVTRKEFLWFAAGSLGKQKDYPNMFKAFSTLVKRHPHATLAVAGGGSGIHALRREAMEMGLGDRVRMLGMRSDIAHLLHASDAFVHAAAWEGVANVVLEAMAARRTVVTTDAGGITEVVRSGQDGYVVPVRDSSALGHALGAVMDMPDADRRAMAQSAQARVHDRFSVDRVADQWEDLFMQLLDRPVSRAAGP